MPKALCRLSILILVYAGPAFALFCQKSSEDWNRWVSQGEPYSTAACDGSDPRGYFEEKKAELEQTSIETIKLRLLAEVAKAALEAGMNDEARSYADQALALAGEDRFRNAGPVTFESASEGDAVALGNLVLGRLALLAGDVKAAENDLLLSGQITAGQAEFWGPNMTLALELLKRHRTESVLQYLDECRAFWRKDDQFGKLDRWIADVRNGKLPDFGSNLVYN
jgi:hypothetical protein